MELPLKLLRTTMFETRKVLMPILMLFVLIGRANGQLAPAQTASSFFQLATPGQFALTLFGGGYVSDQYGTTQEGFQFEQSVTASVGLVGRAMGYQLYVGNPFDNPLAPGSGHRSRLNFGRFQGGLDIKPLDGTNLFILGGGDAGDSHAGVVESDLSSWVLMRSSHPVNLAMSGVWGSENQVWITETDFRTILYSSEQYLLLVGAGGAIYAGGFVHGVEGQGGPNLGIYFPGWRIGLDAQAGYGSARQYGELSIFKQFAWTE
jgi:hypothetical protein